MTIEMTPMQVRAPAKINLSLKILGRRPDGFHNIETMMAPISLFDELDLEKQSRWIDFQCDDLSIPSGEENLVVRAAKAFFDATGKSGGVSIRLTKKIPHGAGLGGGSSDAASTLMALNDLFETKLSNEALADLAGSIGSDIPFFVFRSVAVCKGRGELVSPIKLSEPLSILLLKPDFGVPTALAYQRWQESREIPGIDYGSQNFAGYDFVNELERPVFEKFVFLARMKAWLRKQPEVGAAEMSGSGATMFAVMRPGLDADVLAKRAKSEMDPDLWTCACETL